MKFIVNISLNILSNRNTIPMRNSSLSLIYASVNQI